nr:MAG TPA: hypothetical protein [Caudoviricetes sp.]
MFDNEPDNHCLHDSETGTDNRQKNTSRSK